MGYSGSAVFSNKRMRCKATKYGLN